MRQGRIVYGAVPLPYALPVRGTTGRVFAERGENPIFALAKRGRVRAFPLFAFLGRTILYGREKLSYRIVKIISKLVKICSFIIFPKCFIVKFFIKIIRILSEQISIVLIIPKLLRRAALTIASAPFTPCAERRAALTSFAFLAGACLRIPYQGLRLTSIYHPLLPAINYFCPNSPKRCLSVPKICMIGEAACPFV